jgi:pyochelin biosynthesis protein PchC
MAGTSTRTSAWVRRFHPAPDAPTRLICFPHAGGSATFFFPVSQSMSPAVDVLSIQYPGRQDRRLEPCVGDIFTLADLVTEELLPWADRPIVLFGHSMGATLGFEVATRLEKRGIVPLGFFASGRRAPSRWREERVHLADDDGLIKELRALSGTEARVLEDEEVVRMILPAVRSDYKAAETYRLRPGTPTLTCPVTALTGDSDPHVTLDEAKAWSEHTEGAFDLKVYEGGHFFVSTHAAEIMGEIKAHIAAR